MNEEKPKNVWAEGDKVKAALKARLQEQSYHLWNMIKDNLPVIVIAYEIGDIIRTVVTIEPRALEVIVRAIPDESSNLEEIK